MWSIVPLISIKRPSLSLISAVSWKFILLGSNIATPLLFPEWWRVLLSVDHQQTLLRHYRSLVCCQTPWTWQEAGSETVLLSSWAFFLFQHIPLFSSLLLWGNRCQSKLTCPCRKLISFSMRWKEPGLWFYFLRSLKQKISASISRWSRTQRSVAALYFEINFSQGQLWCQKFCHKRHHVVFLLAFRDAVNADVFPLRLQLQISHFCLYGILWLFHLQERVFKCRATLFDFSYTLLRFLHMCCCGF